MSTLLAREIKQGLHPYINGALQCGFLVDKKCYIDNKHSYKIESGDKNYVIYKCRHCGQIVSKQKKWDHSGKRII